MPFPDFSQELLKLWPARDSAQRLHGYVQARGRRPVTPRRTDLYDDFETLLPPWLAAAKVATGVAPAINVDGQEPVERMLGSATGTASAAATNDATLLRSPSAAIVTFGYAVHVWEARLWRTIGDAAEASRVVCGFHDGLGTPNLDATDGVYFRSKAGANAAQWECVSRTNGVEAAHTAASVYRSTLFSVDGVTLVAQTLRVEVTEDGTAAHFFIDGEWVGSHTNNTPNGSGSHAGQVPNGTARRTGFGLMLLKTAGVAAHQLVVDFVGYSTRMQGDR